MATNDTAVVLDLLQNLHDKIDHLPGMVEEKNVFAGFDGFVDRIMKAVRSKDASTTVYFDTIQEFSSHLGNLSGKSGQVEWVTTKTKIGGNAPILANALGHLKVKSICMGAMGYPTANKLFENLPANCTRVSLAEPGLSDAIEFSDGKLIFSDLSAFQQYHWGYIKQMPAFQQHHENIKACTLFALVDWANLLHATHLWEGFLNDMFAGTTDSARIFFVDLCDPSRRKRSEINDVMQLLNRCCNYGTVILGLNENEANKVWLALNDLEPIHSTHHQFPSLQAIGRFIQEKTEIDMVMIHPKDRILVFKSGEFIELPGYVIDKPAVLTGGGDNLNAGFCFGMLASLPLKECMLLGMAASGAYVKNGVSPSLPALKQYINFWLNELKALKAA